MPIVHIRRSGRALCQRPGAPPLPAGHVWVAWNNATKHMKKHEARYCPECKSTWRRDQVMSSDRSHR